MLNHIDIMGRLTRDPELRMTQNEVSVASFTLAVDRDGKDAGVDFINCVAWRHTADFISKYFKKGSMMVASGKLQLRQYEGKDGSKKTAAEVIVDNAYFGSSKSADTEERKFDPGMMSEDKISQLAGRFSDIVDDLDGTLPF